MRRGGWKFSDLLDNNYKFRRLLRRQFQKVGCQQHLCLDTVASAERNYWKQQAFIFNSSNS